MSFLIDTNVISAVRKRERCDPGVIRWFDSVDSSSLYLSVLVLGEIRRGAEMIRAREPERFEAFNQWLESVRTTFDGRILGVDTAVAEEWGRLGVRRTLPVIDGLLAATAKVHGLTFVTRNTADVADLDITILNPFHGR